MIYKNLLISLIFLYLIPNFVTAKRLTQATKLSFSSKLTQDDGDDFERIVEEFAVPSELTYQTETTEKDKSPLPDPCPEKGRTYCENPPDYPEEQIRKLLEESKINITALNVDYSLDDGSNIDLGNRGDNDQPLCILNRTFIEPGKMVAEDGEWKFIAPGYLILIEECVSANASCAVLPKDYEAKCEQKYLVRKLYALNGTELSPLKFNVPSCCVCTLVPNPNMVRRRRRHAKTSKQRADNERDGRNANFQDQIKSLENQPPPAISNRKSIDNIICLKEFDTLCEKVKDYPTEIVANLGKRGAFKNSPLFEEAKSVDPLAPRTDSDGKVTMCEVDARVWTPQAVKTTNGVVKLVVQDEANGMYQKIVTEDCKSKVCKYEDEFPHDYGPRCKQMYVERKLVMIDTDGKNVSLDTTKYPSCCKCFHQLSGVGNVK